MVVSTRVVLPVVVLTGRTLKRDGLREAPLILAVLEAVGQASDLVEVYERLPFPRSFTTAAIDIAVSKGYLTIEEDSIKIPDATRQGLLDGSLTARLIGRQTGVDSEWCVDLVRGYLLPIDWVRKNERGRPDKDDILTPPRFTPDEMRDWVPRLVRDEVSPESLRVSQELQVVARASMFTFGSASRLLFADNVPLPVRKAIIEAHPDAFKKRFQGSGVREKWVDRVLMGIFREAEEHSELVRAAFLNREWGESNCSLGSTSKRQSESWGRRLSIALDSDSDVEYVDPVADYPQQQYAALAELCRRGRGRIALLTSFLNPEHVQALANALNELDKGAAILLLYGHANEETRQEQLAKASEYEQVLRKRLRGDLRIVIKPTKSRSHEKIVVTGNSEVMVGSWNPGSSNPAASYLEVSVIVRSFSIAGKCLRLLVDELAQDETTMLRNLEGVLPSTAPFRSSPVLPRLIAFNMTSAQLAETPRPSPAVYHSWRRQFQGLLQAMWAEWTCPRIVVITGDEIRDTVVEQVANAKRSVLITTDAVTPAGLDVSLAGSLLANGKVVRILWGRADPSDLPPGPERSALEDEVERTGALLEKFRQSDPARVLVRPSPMRNHAKVLVVDGERILVASDNLLAYGKEKTRSSSRELGLLIESPLIARDVLSRALYHAPELQAPPTIGMQDPPWDLFGVISWEARTRWREGGRSRALTVSEAVDRFLSVPRFQAVLDVFREHYKGATQVDREAEAIRWATESMGVVQRWDPDRRLALLMPFDAEPPPPPLTDLPRPGIGLRRK